VSKAATRKLPPIVGVFFLPIFSDSAASSFWSVFVTSSPTRCRASQAIVGRPHHNASVKAVRAAMAMRNEM
jgi:hypothetical protein